MRAEIGQMTLDRTLAERSHLNANIVSAINSAAIDWASILESEGARQAAINVAEGTKESVILASEAEKAEQINKASGEAEAILLRADATAEGIRRIALSIKESHGPEAVALTVAEKYVEAFGQLAKQGNSVIVPASVSDAGSMIAQVFIGTIHFHVL
ncbi:12650_t:CDS:2 [Racocetra fulgida]|uniref:12650_t:CDS:1 n=1 Tax=Racocetra fulgida TaxID=60492 RepID=A0A9N8VYZ7_9GLOM|nr:12650_t:CDS:2 [Racocetra fulgida]